MLPGIFKMFYYLIDMFACRLTRIVEDLERVLSRSDFVTIETLLQDFGILTGLYQRVVSGNSTGRIGIHLKTSYMQLL